MKCLMMKIVPKPMHLGAQQNNPKIQNPKERKQRKKLKKENRCT